MTVALDLLLASGIRRLILGMSPCPVPVATLSQDAPPGIAPLHVAAEGERFPRGALALFDDDTGESRIVIDSASATQLNLRAAAMSMRGLQFTHPAGTRLYCNLYSGRLLDPNPNLALGDPVFEIGVMRQDGQPIQTPRGWVYVYALHIAYSLRLQPPSGSQVDVNEWALEQQERARTQLEAVGDALKDRGQVTVATSGVPDHITFDIGGSSHLSSGAAESRDWSQLVGDVGTYDFTAALNTLWTTLKSFA